MNRKIGLTYSQKEKCTPPLSQLVFIFSCLYHCKDILNTWNFFGIKVDFVTTEDYWIRYYSIQLSAWKVGVFKATSFFTIFHSKTKNVIIRSLLAVLTSSYFVSLKNKFSATRTELNCLLTSSRLDTKLL